jgi:hypothetical protein
MKDDMDDSNESLANEVSEAMHKVFFGEYNRMRTPDHIPERLYHFCDSNAMASVIQHRTLWASLATCLNDASEVEFGLSRARNLIESILATKNSAFLRHTKQLINESIIQPYIACFCPSADRALHWLHYGRSGSGVALGLDGARVVPNDQFILVRVSYDIDAFDVRILRVIAAFEQEIQRLKPEMMAFSAAEMEKFAAKLMAVLVGGMVAFLKDPAFAAEEEWRLVCTELDANWMPDDVLPKPPSKDMRVTQTGRLVPYRKIVYGDDSFPLTEIVLGHSCVVRAEKDPGLSVLLRQSFKKELMPKVRVADVPVRY